MTDTQRINWLIDLVNKEGGLVLHNGDFGGSKYAGLAFGQRFRRTLREAIDQCAGVDAKAKAKTHAD